MKRKVTIEMIAQDAGVSKMTVSRALNSPEKLKKSTLIKILNSMRKYEYKPRFVARILAGSRSNSFGFVVKSNEDFIIPPFYGECIRGASDWFKKQNYRSMIFNMADEQSSSLFIDYVNSSLIDGLILFEGTHQESLLKTLKDNDIPVVLVGEDPGEMYDFYSVSSDNYNGAKMAVEYLISKGSHEICYITGTGTKPSVAERLRGYMDVIRKYGLKPITISVENTLKGGMKAVEQLIKEHPGFNGLFCFSDLIAIGALRGLRKKGFDIPKDIRVIGFDNIHISEYVFPSLTTVSQDMSLMGEIAAKTLLQIMNDPIPGSFEKHVKLPTRLIIRESA
jgi:LacI family transcriptional regulator